MGVPQWPPDLGDDNTVAGDHRRSADFVHRHPGEKKPAPPRYHKDKGNTETNQRSMKTVSVE
jgi:hypothetical protein